MIRSCHAMLRRTVAHCLGLLRYRCLWKKHSFHASHCPVIQQQKLLSSPWFGAPKENLPTCLLLRRSVFFTDAGIVWLRSTASLPTYCFMSTGPSSDVSRSSISIQPAGMPQPLAPGNGFSTPLSSISFSVGRPGYCFLCAFCFVARSTRSSPELHHLFTRTRPIFIIISPEYRIATP